MESNRRKSKWQSSPRPRPLAPKHFRLAPLHSLRRTQRSNLPARRRRTSQPRPLRPPQPLPSPPLRPHHRRTTNLKPRPTFAEKFAYFTAKVKKFGKVCVRPFNDVVSEIK